MICDVKTVPHPLGEDVRRALSDAYPELDQVVVEAAVRLAHRRVQQEGHVSAPRLRQAAEDLLRFDVAG